VKAAARDGRTIDVRRRWLPWKPRLREADAGVDPIGFDLDADDLAGVAVVLVVFLLVLIFPVVVAVALLAGEVLVLLLLIPLFLLARVVPVLPWTVEARHEGTLVPATALPMEICTLPRVVTRGRVQISCIPW
jgi:hypothetical protein